MLCKIDHNKFDMAILISDRTEIKDKELYQQRFLKKSIFIRKL